MRFASLALSCLLSVAAFVGQVHGQEQVNACAQACIRRGPGRQCDSVTDPNCICGEGKTISSCIASNCGSQQEAWSSLSASICGLATPTSSVTTFTGPPFSLTSITTLPITAPTPSPPVSGGSSAVSLPTSSGSNSTATLPPTSSSSSNTATLLPTTGTPTAPSGSGIGTATGTATGADASQTSNAARAMKLDGSWHLGTVFGVGVVGAALGGTLALL
ncbi:hypothetical protein C8Q74DRAFT_1261737 [Fomes fomentarius]|nr:hypothetical protein C8Q74DRAFT_1261737 [Fomes fomentarius]